MVNLTSTMAIQPHPFRSHGSITFGQQAGTPGEPPPDPLADLDFDTALNPKYRIVESALTDDERATYQAFCEFLEPFHTPRHPMRMRYLATDEGKLAMLFEHALFIGTPLLTPNPQDNADSFEEARIRTQTFLLAVPPTLASLIKNNPQAAKSACLQLYTTLIESGDADFARTIDFTRTFDPDKLL